MLPFAQIKNNPDLRKYKIYRIFSLERLFEIINNRSLVLLSPNKWEDPYEETLQEILEQRNRDRIFGLCWSLKARSDALWRIYSPNSTSVRITTTLGDLVDAFEMDEVTFNEANLFFGAVTYLPETTSRKVPNKYLDKHVLSLKRDNFQRDVFTITDAIMDLLDDNSPGVWRTPDEVAKSFYLKRLAFEHEKEIRLIYVDGNENDSGDGLFKIRIDPFKLINSIQFDPRMDNNVFESLKIGLNAKISDHNISITKSSLYKVPKKIQKLIPKQGKS